MDCETEADFQAQLESLKEVCDEREKAHLPAGKQPSFHKYICEKVTKVHVIEFYHCTAAKHLFTFSVLGS